MHISKSVLWAQAPWVTTFEFPPQKQERKGGWEPSLASNLTLNFMVLIRLYWPGQVHSLVKDNKLDLCYKIQNVRGRQALHKGQSLILCTARNIFALFHATSYIVSVIHKSKLRVHYSRQDLEAFEKISPSEPIRLEEKATFTPKIKTLILNFWIFTN